MDIDQRIGLAAGKIWEHLKNAGPASVTNLMEATGLQRPQVHQALGWLAREGKIVVELHNGKVERYRLR